MTSGERRAEGIAAQAGHFIDPANASLTPPIQSPATSFGGVKTLVEHRANIEGSENHVPESLLRLSIGIEDLHELIGDLEQMLSGVS